MIRMKVNRKRGEQYAHEIIADEPVTITVTVIRGRPYTNIYRGDEVDFEAEHPIGAYDGGLGPLNNHNWTEPDPLPV